MKNVKKFLAALLCVCTLAGIMMPAAVEWSGQLNADGTFMSGVSYKVTVTMDRSCPSSTGLSQNKRTPI